MKKNLLSALALIVSMGVAIATIPNQLSCATTKDTAVTVAKACLGPVDPLVVTAVHEASFSTLEAELPAVLDQLKECVARLAAEEVQHELTALIEAKAAAPEVANAVPIDVARARVDAWLLAHGGPAAPIKKGLPGGGHNCCWKPGIWSTIPSCGPPVALTPSNLSSHCSCAPIQLWC